MPLVSLASSLCITYLLKAKVEKWSPDHWQVLVVALGVALVAPLFIFIYLLNVVLIRCFGRSELAIQLKARWYDFLTSATEQSRQPADYVDRVATLQLRVSMPSVVREVVDTLLAEHKAACDSLQETIDHFSAHNELGAFVKVLGNRWTTPVDFVKHPPRLVDDPVHGCVTLDSELSTVIAQPIVQRLSRVRQLSFSYTQFPSATHSRLSHVLGVAHNVENALRGVFSRGVYYEAGAVDAVALPRSILDQRDAITRRAKLLAILHDLGHGPFGHALDNYVGYTNRHQITANPDKVYSRLYVKKHLRTVLASLGYDADDLVRILDTERADLTGFDALVGDLVDSSMDMDRMDYLMRDAHMTGLSMGFTNTDALIQCVRPVKSGDAYLLAYDIAGVEYMEHLLYAREAMYRGCYEHPRKRAAERLFERLIRAVAEDDPGTIDDLYILTDEEVLCALRLVKLKSDNAKRLLEQLVTNSDYVVVHDVQANSPNISEEASVWVKGAAKGKGKPSYIDRPAEWEDVIARASIGQERGFQIQVIVAPPGAYEQKFDAATILFRDHNALYQTKEFFEIASGVKNVLSAMNPARSRIKVMCPSDLSKDEREAVKQASIATLGY